MKKSQASVILDYLREHDGITSMEAFELCGATRLSAIIFNLRNKGYEITCEDVKTVNRFGNACIYGKYTLVSEPKDVAGE